MLVEGMEPNFKQQKCSNKYSERFSVGLHRKHVIFGGPQDYPNTKIR